MGLTVYKKIIARLENDRGLQEEMGKVAGYSSGSNFRKALEEGRSVEKLDGLVKVIKTLFPENCNQLLIQYANELDTKKMTIKLLLEYATLFHMEELKLVIIDRLKESGKSDSLEWAYFYETDHLIEKGKIGCMEGINLLSSKKSSKVETNVFSKIAQTYCYYDMRNIYMLNFCLDEIERETEKIKNSFLRNAYQGRIFRIKVDINLHTDKIGSLLESSFNIQDALEPTKAMLYLQIGNSFMIKSYEKSMYYLNKSLENRYNGSEITTNQSINFVNLLWDKTDKFVFDGTKSNELFYYVKTKNKSEALRLIKKINIDEYNNQQLGFHNFYLGLLFEDKNYFYKSIEFFAKAGEKFYKQLPIIELRKKGENEVILSALSA